MSFANISPFGSYLGSEIREQFFSDAKVNELHSSEVQVFDNTLTTYQRYSTSFTDIKDPESNIWDAGFVVEYKLFISDDGAMLRDIAFDNANGRPNSNQVFIFIESDEDLLSDRFMHIKAGDKTVVDEIVFRSVTNQTYPLNNEDFTTLLSSTKVSKAAFEESLMDILTKGVKTLFKPNRWLSKILGNLVKIIDDNLKIEEKWWNPETPLEQLHFDQLMETLEQKSTQLQQKLIYFKEKVLDKVESKKFPLSAILDKVIAVLNGVIEAFTKGVTSLAEALANNIQSLISLLSGLWNGIVDMISGIVFLIKLAIDIPYQTAKAVKAGVNTFSNREQIFEHIDNILDTIVNIKWGELLSHLWQEIKKLPSNFVEAFLALLKKGGEKIDKAVKKLTPYSILYYIGFVATWFIPIGLIAKILGKAGKVGAALGKALVKLEQLVAEAVGIAVKAGKKAADTLGKLLKALTAKLRQGTKSLVKLIDNIFKKIKDWVDDLLGKGPIARKKAYDNFTLQITKKNLDELIEHIFEGHFGIYRRKYFSTKGIHSIDDLANEQIRIVESSKIPPRPNADELFKAKVQKQYTRGQWVDKLDNGGYSTFFPENWDRQRILEEIAFAFNNKTASSNPVFFQGYTSNGIKIELIIRNAEIKTVYPKF